MPSTPEKVTESPSRKRWNAAVTKAGFELVIAVGTRDTAPTVARAAPVAAERSARTLAAPWRSPPCDTDALEQ
jgi:hypothetical protein